MSNPNCTTSESVFTVINACNGEVVEFEGTERFCFDVSTNPSGKLQQRFHNSITGQGTGSQGNEYVVHSIVNIVLNFNPGQTFEQTQTTNFHVIGKGKAPNFIVKVRFHITITPNGDISVTRNIVDTECQQ